VARAAALRERLDRLLVTSSGMPRDGARAAPDGRSARAEVVDSVRRWATEVEMAVAQVHQQAAQLYESWLERPISPLARERLARRTRTHRDRLASGPAVERLVERTLTLFEDRAGAGTTAGREASGLIVLAALKRLQTAVDRRIEAYVAASRREGGSWAEIASALQVTRQAAHERFRHCGQPA
jgi:hypothetical protein